MKAMKPRCVWLIAVIWLLSDLGASARLTADQQDPPKSLGMDVVLLIDSSESTRKTDPNDDRLKAAHFLLDYLEATAELLQVNHRAAIANFGGEVGVASPLQLVGQRRVHQAIQKQTIPNTDFRPALEFAIRELKGSSVGTGWQAIVVLFTDGLPDFGSGTLEGKDLERYFSGEAIPGDPEELQLNQLVGELHEMGSEMFVVAVGQRMEAAKGWSSLLDESSYVELGSIEQLATAYHRIFSEKLGFENVEQYELTSGEPVTVGFEPLLEHATLSFIKKQPGATVTLEGVKGGKPRRITGGGAEELHEVYEITDPAANGKLKAVISTGSARLLVAQRRPQITVQEPISPQVLGMPISVILSIGERGHTEAYKRMSVFATVSGPGFIEPITEEFTPVDEETMRLVTEPITVPGLYDVEVGVRQRGEVLKGFGEHLQIRLEPIPTISSVEIGQNRVHGHPPELSVTIDDVSNAMSLRYAWLSISGSNEEPVRLYPLDGRVERISRSKVKLRKPILLSYGTEKSQLAVGLSGITSSGQSYFYLHDGTVTVRNAWSWAWALVALLVGFSTAGVGNRVLAARRVTSAGSELPNLTRGKEGRAGVSPVLIDTVCNFLKSGKLDATPYDDPAVIDPWLANLRRLIEILDLSGKKRMIGSLWYPTNLRVRKVREDILKYCVEGPNAVEEEGMEILAHIKKEVGGRIGPTGPE